MNVGIYQSASSLAALERWQDAVTQNITSSQVPGFKKRTVDFSVVNGGELQTNERGDVGRGDGEPLYYPKATYGINYQQGESHPTRRDLDMAIEGKGFFEVQMEDGTKAYTRAGDFRLRPDRTLVNSNGLEVLNDSGFPIQLPNNGGEITLTEKGLLSQGGVPVGKVGVVEFPDDQKLVPIKNGLFMPTGGMEATAVENPVVMQGYLEGSNITPLREMVDLVTISRAYEANQKLIQSRDQTMQKALDALG